MKGEKNMAELKEDYRKEERINGIVYDMSPSADYRHGIVNSNIHAILKQHLKNNYTFFHIKNPARLIRSPNWIYRVGSD